MIPEALDVLRDHAKRLVEGKVPMTDLLIAKRLSLHPDSYSHDVLQAIAAKQLMKEGVEISAGQTVQYLITNSESKNAYRRVKPAQLLEANVHYDTRKYLNLLLTSAANILSPFGYTTKNLYDLVVHRKEQKPLQ
jgi:DNA polymerase elongation subunit (family B)